jgi:non-ribosomal peptide synthetase component F
VVKTGIDMLVGIMAVLRCHAQYVPLDGTAIPNAILKFVLEQTRGRTILTLRPTRYRLSQISDSNVVAVGDMECDEEGQGSLKDFKSQHAPRMGAM